MPLLLFLFALLILGESGEEILAFLDFLVSVGVNDLSKILHESEVRSHLVSESSQLAELWDQGNLITSLSVLVDQEWLVWIRDGLIVLGLVVLSITHLSSLLVESSLRAESEVNSINLISFLIVSSDDGGSYNTI